MIWRSRAGRVAASLLVVSLLFGCFFREAGCQAEEVKEYVLIVDNTYTYRLNTPLYEQIRSMWGEAGTEQILELLRQVYGADQVPQQASTMSIRIYTYTSSDGMSGGTAGADGGSLSGGTQTEPSDFDISSGRLIRYRGKSKVVTLPGTVTSISQGAFYGNGAVQKLIVPASVQTIDQYAFYQCSNLKYIVFAGKCKSVRNSMIYGCDQLVSIVAPRNSKEYKYAEKHGIRAFTADRPTFGQGQLHLLAGDKEKLVLYNTAGSVRWKSSRTPVAAVSASGMVTCRKEGTAKITAEVNGKKYIIVVRVSGKSEEKRIRQIVRTVIRKGMSTREKVKAVHDWLVKHVKYDYNNYLRGRVPAVSHTSKGALLRGIAVCDGYSKAMQKIMKRLRIPCQVVIGRTKGGGHAWNRVKVDGRWLYVDVTFDDPIVNGKNTNTKPYYTYFLKTGKQMRKSHSW